MASKLTEYQWQLIHEQWSAGVSYAELGRRFDIGPATISGRAKREGWERQEVPDEPERPETVNFGNPESDPEQKPAADSADANLGEFISDYVPPEVTESHRSELGRRVAQAIKDKRAEALEPRKSDALPSDPDELAAYAERLRRENDQLKAQVEELDPIAHIDPYTSPEEVVATFGDEALIEMAHGRFALENLERHRQGKPMLDMSTQPQIFEAMIIQIVEELLREQVRVDGTRRLRVQKWVKPDGRGPGGRGTQIQVPMEEQINNMKGESLAPVAKARAKGWRLMAPYRCQALDCWQVAPRQVAPDGAEEGPFVYDGYCSEEHRALDPYLNAKPIEGVSTTMTSRMAGSGTGG